MVGSWSKIISAKFFSKFLFCKNKLLDENNFLQKNVGAHINFNLISAPIRFILICPAIESEQYYLKIIAGLGSLLEKIIAGKQ